MAGLNRVVLIGNLTADPELRYTQQGTARARFRIAVNRRYRDREGVLQEEAIFVPIVVWGPQGENCARYLAKGQAVAVDGRLRIESFETPEGERRKVTEVVANTVQFLGGPRGGEAESQSEAEAGRAGEIGEGEGTEARAQSISAEEKEDDEGASGAGAREDEGGDGDGDGDVDEEEGVPF